MSNSDSCPYPNIDTEYVGNLNVDSIIESYEALSSARLLREAVGTYIADLVDISIRQNNDVYLDYVQRLTCHEDAAIRLLGFECISNVAEVDTTVSLYLSWLADCDPAVTYEGRRTITERLSAFDAEPRLTAGHIITLAKALARTTSPRGVGDR